MVVLCCSHACLQVQQPGGLRLILLGCIAWARARTRRDQPCHGLRCCLQLAGLVLLLYLLLRITQLLLEILIPKGRTKRNVQNDHGGGACGLPSGWGAPFHDLLAAGSKLRGVEAWEVALDEAEDQDVANRG